MCCILPLSRLRRGVLAQVADQADDVLGDESAEGAAGIAADPPPPRRVQDEPRGLQEQRILVNESASLRGDRAGVGALPDRERQAMFGDELRGGGLVVD